MSGNTLLTTVLVLAATSATALAAGANLHRVTYPGDQATSAYNLASRANSNVFLVWEKSPASASAVQGFIVDSGKFPFQADAAIAQWKSLVSATAPPAFVYLTHGHPDHFGGLAYLKQEWPELPIHTGSQEVIDELIQFTTTSSYGVCPSVPPATPGTCLLVGPLAMPSAFDYSGNVTVATSADLAVVSARLGKLSIFDIPRITETRWATPLYMEDANILFPGDLIGVQAHKYTTIFLSGAPTFQTPDYPANDDYLCGWIDSMSQIACSFPEDVEVAAGHGPTSSAYGAPLRVITAENIAWVMQYRAAVARSCDAQYVWDEMIATYPSYGDRDYIDFFGSFGHVPKTAEGLGCTCSASTSPNPGIYVGTPRDCTTQAGYQQLPACRFAPGTLLRSSSCVGNLQQLVATARASAGGDDDDHHSTAILGLAAACFVLIVAVVLLLVIIVSKLGKAGAPAAQPPAASGSDTVNPLVAAGR